MRRALIAQKQKAGRPVLVGTVTVAEGATFDGTVELSPVKGGSTVLRTVAS